jgi:hypothetical protein
MRLVIMQVGSLMFGPGQRYDVLVCSRDSAFLSSPKPVWIRASQTTVPTGQQVHEAKAVMYFARSQASRLPAYAAAPVVLGPALSLYTGTDNISSMSLKVRTRVLGTSSVTQAFWLRPWQADISVRSRCCNRNLCY